MDKAHQLSVHAIFVSIFIWTSVGHGDSPEIYVKKFIELSQSQSQVISLQQTNTLEVSVSIAAKIEGIDGRCIHDDDGSLKVELNGSLWDGHSETEKEMLVFHELGHCILERPHRDDYLAEGYEYIPASLMNSAGGVPTQQQYLRYQSQYLEELFARKPHQPFIAYIRQSWVGAELFAFYESLSAIFVAPNTNCKLSHSKPKT